MELIQTTADEIIAHISSRFGPLKVANKYSRSALASLCRQTAGRVCPTSVRFLINTVVEPLEALGLADLTTPVSEVIETLISQGDLLESANIAEDSNSTRQTLIYAAPPQFVVLSAFRILLLGMQPDDPKALPETLTKHIQQVDCLRVLTPPDCSKSIEQLQDLGLYQLDQATWLKAPPIKPAVMYREQFDATLMEAGHAGEIRDLFILDADKSAKFYPGRWRQPREDDTGHFVARRGVNFGNKIWCYVALEKGLPTRLVDLPFGSTDERGCDQAWRLQAAIDAMKGAPQQVRVRSPKADTVILDIFSPIPKWLERRWCAGGQQIEREGCLASYQLQSRGVEEELEFAKAHMWLEHSLP